MTKTLAEFYESEIEFHQAQKSHANHEIQAIKRSSDLKIRALHKEIDKIDITITELQKLYDNEREAETKYATAKPETL